MLKQIAALAVLFLVTEPAFADMPGDVNLQGVAAVEAGEPGTSAPASVRDCEARFRSLRARSQMPPSERERALEACRAVAQARAHDGRLAASGD